MLTETVRVAGVFPLVGDTESQGAVAGRLWNRCWALRLPGWSGQIAGPPTNGSRRSSGRCGKRLGVDGRDFSAV